MCRATPISIRFDLLLGVALSLTMVGIQIFRYRPLLAMPGGPASVVETATVLLLYGIITTWMTGRYAPALATVLLVGTPVGLAAAAVQIAHLATENFVHLVSQWEGIASLTFMLGTFLIWGVAGYRSARIAGAIAPAVAAGSWSAIVTMTTLVTFGFTFEFYLVPPKPEYVATWGEFIRSGWTDARAFAIANTLDSALSHLILGPIVGAICGGGAGLVAVRTATRMSGS